VIVYDRRVQPVRQAGRALSWRLSRSWQALLDHLKIDAAWILGGCMGCSVALLSAWYPKRPAVAAALAGGRLSLEGQQPSPLPAPL
jgi:pimeloyl-ACP methyl ester carboxylesterase